MQPRTLIRVGQRGRHLLDQASLLSHLPQQPDPGMGNHTLAVRGHLDPSPCALANTGPAQAPASTADSTSAPARVFSEATVVARAQDGDTDAFEQLVRSYQADLLRLG